MFKFNYDEKEYILSDENFDELINDDDKPVKDIDKDMIIELLKNSPEEIIFGEEFYIEACPKCLKGIKEKEKFFPFLEYHFYIYTKEEKYVISTIDKDYQGKSFNKLSRSNLVDDSYIVSIIICKHCNDYIIQVENCEV
ncbi:MAG TPA: DUF3785 domain-containing protein [Terrisporobacter glycolicus]|uniref:DUF3785 family protein n=1 Tax=Terrisporobacter TaxID=1505652 RepID=UPI000E9A4475|nr:MULTISPECIES: DUF3785 family protein [Terrisporobacter]MBN9647378.1 DUF3785 family protein [Terrisporobacter glycolicus]HBI91403.1 DUF3785 domain-containing protein [Terrisporobacter hibernicus]